MTDDRKLNPKYKEDLSEYVVEVIVKRPHFHKEMVMAVSECKMRFEKGDILAVHDALVCCEQGALPLPPWLSQVVRRHVIDSLTGGLNGSRGRSNSPLGQAKKDLKAQAHYRLVKKCQRIASSLEAERMVSGILTSGRLQGIGNLEHVFPPMLWEKIQDPKSSLSISDFGNTLKSQYLAVSKILRGTFAQAEPRTIRESYKSISKAMTDGSHHRSHLDWFASAEPETLQALGLQIDMSEAEMLAWEMGQELVEPERHMSQLDEEFFVDLGEIEGMAKKS